MDMVQQGRFAGRSKRFVDPLNDLQDFFSENPLVVTAAVPIRMPEVTMGD